MAPTSSNSSRPAGPRKAQDNNSGLNLKTIVAFAVTKWYWFVISLIITMGAATYYLMKTTPLYTRTISFLIRNNDKSNPETSIDMSELGIGQTKTNLENEIRILKSPSLMKEVVQILNLNNSYHIQEGLRTNILYKKSPVIFNTPISENETYFSFDFKLLKDGKIEIRDMSMEGAGDEVLTVAFGDTVKVGNIKFAVTKPEWKASQYVNKDIHFTHTPIKDAAKGFASGISAVLGSDKSSIIEISTTCPSVQEADDILTTLIQVYNKRWIEEKNQIAVSTSQFIDERLNVIQQELGSVESDISSYKSAHLMPSAEATASLFLTQTENARSNIVSLENQISIAEIVRQQLSGSSFDLTLPTNTGLINAEIQSAIGEFNKLVIERKRLLETTSDANPVIKDREQTLRTLRDNVILSINSYITTLKAQLNNARRQESLSTGRLAANPNQAKYLLGVERQQKVKESLYLFLLQKREENELTQAFTAYNSSLVDEPYGSKAPTFPKRNNILIMAFIAGLGIPLAIFVTREMLDTKIRGKKDLASLTIPYLGEIPLGVKKKNAIARIFSKKQAPERKIMVTERGRDMINESFRVLRTNLEYMAVDNGDKKCQVVAITSANPGSGKTFVSVNLAKVLAIKGKRVLLTDLDVRKGSLSRMVGKPKIGITDFIVGKVGKSDIIISEVDNTPTLDLIAVGSVPPNPAELLSSEKLDVLIEGFKKEYDFIILDCPPVEVVTDAKIINRLADTTIFIIRAGMLEKDELPVIQEYFDQNRYKNMAILLNSTDIHSGYGYHRYGYHYGYGKGYGYGYGYGYGNSSDKES